MNVTTRADRPDKEPLTPTERAALTAIRDGADVFSMTTAKTLRHLERTRPELLEICPAMGEYGPRDQHPYFGAILTAAGDDALGEEP